MSELDELARLFVANPGTVAELVKQDPKLAEALANELREKTAGVRPSVDSFRRIYAAFFGRPLPRVAEPVAEEFIWALEQKKGVVFEAWRGFGKSTFFTAWGPAVMGWRPVGSTALVRVNDAKAKEMGKAIATLIETNPGWKRLFPHVVPDTQAGWSVEKGFNVMDTRVTGDPSTKDFASNYARWRMMCLADHISEQSLLCSGIESGSIIGLHPTNGMWFDDLHDELNTRSIAELKKTTDTLQGNIIPTWFSAGGSPTLGVFCTPWSKNPPDAYQMMLKTGLFRHVKLPIFTEDPTGEEIPATVTTANGEEAVDPDWAGKKVKLTWPEVFDIHRVAQMIVTMKTRFGQMALLNIELSKPKNMRYMEFPAKDIKWDKWPMTSGVDPVGTVEGVSAGTGISHFAMAFLLKSPYNNLVLADGIIEKCDAMAGERYVVETQRTFMKTHIASSVETNGAGAVFVALVTRNKGVKIHPHAVSELGTGSKKDRQYQFLQPLFANGSIVVSDADTPFLNAAREYLDIFPNFAKDSYLWDVGDAIAIAALDVPEIWSRVVVTDNRDTSIWAQQNTSLGSVWNSLGSR